MLARAETRPHTVLMPNLGDVACAILLAPATAVLVSVGGVLVGLLAGADSAQASIPLGVGAFVLLPPASILLRARARSLSLEWSCLLLLITIMSMVATVAALAIAMSFAYAWFMRGF